jgi:hypothetical protein
MWSQVVKMLEEEKHFALDQKAGQVKEVELLEKDGDVKKKGLSPLSLTNKLTITHKLLNFLYTLVFICIKKS